MHSILFLPAFVALPKPLGRLADLAQSPVILVLWGVALLLLIALPLLYSRLRRRKVRRVYPLNPLDLATLSEPKPEDQQSERYRQQNLAEATR